MPRALEEVSKEAMDLPVSQRLALAGLLLESAASPGDSDADALWDLEIRDRIRFIDEGQVMGVASEEVMRAAEKRLVS